MEYFPPCPAGVLTLLRDAYGKPTNEIGYETDGESGDGGGRWRRGGGGLGNSSFCACRSKVVIVHVGGGTDRDPCAPKWRSLAWLRSCHAKMPLSQEGPDPLPRLYPTRGLLLQAISVSSVRTLRTPSSLAAACCTGRCFPVACAACLTTPTYGPGTLCGSLTWVWALGSCAYRVRGRHCVTVSNLAGPPYHVLPFPTPRPVLPCPHPPPPTQLPVQCYLGTPFAAPPLSPRQCS
jgi:hypothetical protein